MIKRTQQQERDRAVRRIYRVQRIMYEIQVYVSRPEKSNYQRWMHALAVVAQWKWARMTEDIMMSPENVDQCHHYDLEAHCPNDVCPHKKHCRLRRIAAGAVDVELAVKE